MIKCGIKLLIHGYVISPPLYWACDYLPMLVLKLIHVSRRFPWSAWVTSPILNHNKNKQNAKLWIQYLVICLLFFAFYLYWIMCRLFLMDFYCFTNDNTWHVDNALWFDAISNSRTKSTVISNSENDSYFILAFISVQQVTQIRQWEVPFICLHCIQFRSMSGAFMDGHLLIYRCGKFICWTVSKRIIEREILLVAWMNRLRLKRNFPLK